MTHTDTIRELRELLEKERQNALGPMDKWLIKDVSFPQTRLDVALAALYNLPMLLDAAERAQRYEAALRDCDYHADILKTCIEQKFSQQEILIAINNVIQAGEDAAKALAPEPEKENGK